MTAHDALQQIRFSPMTPLERYRKDLDHEEFLPDPAQEHAVHNLQRVYDELLA